MANDNTELGKFILDGIRPAPRGVPQIEVTFDIDTDGIVHVSAKDKGTGKEQSIRITAPHKLSEAEIEKMVKEAEKFADEDKTRKEEAELLNQANTVFYATEKSLKDYGDKVPASDKESIEKELKNLKEKIEKKDMDGMKAGIESLQKASHKLAEEVYKATASQQAQQAGAAGGQEAPGDAPRQEQDAGGDKKDDDVIDADFKTE
jgi:molecular chaperone DnaK